MFGGFVEGIMKSSRYHVYGIGNAMLDIDYQVTAEVLAELGITKGIMTLVDEARQLAIVERLKGHTRQKVASGGSAANTMIALQYFGGKGYYSCKIAGDETGAHYYEDMKMAGLHSNMDQEARVTGHTGKCIVLVTPDADRTMQTFLGVSETLSELQLNELALAASEYLYIEGYLMTSPSARGAVQKALDIAKANNVKISITLSDPAIAKYFKAHFDEVLAHQVDLLFCNQEEALIYTGARDIVEAQQHLRQIAKQFVITRGAEGSLLFDGQRYIEVAPEKIKAIDTVGAGDMYAGAMLYGLTHGLGWELSGRLASLTSAQVVTQYGPRITQAQAQNLLNQTLKHPKITA